jgi:hypothetical protein
MKFISRHAGFFEFYLWTASQWITLVVQKQRQWLARFSLDTILSMDNTHNSFIFKEWRVIVLFVL